MTTFILVVEELSRLDGAAGWNVMIGAEGGAFAAYLPEETARELVAPAHAVVAGSFQPKGGARPVEGGYRVSGVWPLASGCAHLFPPTATFIAHERTAELLRRTNDPRRPVPTQTFDGARNRVQIGEHQLFLDYHDTNHLPGNLFIHAPQHRLLALVDVIIPRWAPFFRLDTARDIPGFVAAVDKTLEYDFETFFGGHMGWYGTRADVIETREWTRDLQNASAEAVRTVEHNEAIQGVDPDNGYAQLGAYYHALVDTSAGLMPAKWLTRLGGADVFLRDNCSAMTVSVLND